MALLLELSIGQAIYLMNKDGVLLKMTGVDIVKDKMTIAFDIGDDVEVLREPVLKRIIKETGKYTYPAMKRSAEKGSVKEKFDYLVEKIEDELFNQM